MFKSHSEEEADQVLICDFAHFHVLNIVGSFQLLV